MKSYSRARRNSLVVLCHLTLAAGAWSAPARAQDTTAAEPSKARAEARAKVAEGAKLYAAGQFGPAIEQYEAARQLFDSPKISYNLGLAYRGLGRRALAVFHFDRFVRGARDAAPAHLAAARAEIQRLAGTVGFVAISSDTEGADVFVDGVAFGSTPLSGPIPVDPGNHELKVRNTVWGERSRRFTAAAGRTVAVRLDFRSAPQAGARSASASGPPGRPTRALATGTQMAPGANPSAVGSGPAQAEALIREATDLRKAGKDARAYPLFLKAYEVQTTPRTAAQLGLVEMQLGYWLQAEAHLMEALVAVRDPWIASNRADLEKSLAEARAAIGEILVKGAPPGAEVLVSGKPVGRLPLSAPIRAGHGLVNVEVRAPGYASAFRSLTVSGGKREELDVTLEAAPGAATRDAYPASSLDLRSPGPAMEDDHIGAPAGGFSTVARPLAWTSTGLAAAALGFGIYESLRWTQKVEEFESHVSTPAAGQPPRRDCGIDDPGRGGRECDAIYSQMGRARKLAIAGYAVGGALAAGAVTLFVISADDRPARPVALACGITLTGVGGRCRVTF